MKLHKIKRQISVLYSTLQGWEEAQNATTTALEANGSAVQENEKYLNSIQGKVEQFNVALQQMWTNTISTEQVQTFVEFGTKLVQIIDNLGAFKIILSLATTALVIHSGILGSIKNTYKSAMGAQTLMGATTKALSATFTGLNVSAMLATVGVEALKASLTFGASLLITTLITGLSTAISDLIVTSDEYTDKGLQAIDTAKGLSDEFNTNKETVDGLKQRYAELAQGIDVFNKNTGALTTDEYKEFVSLNNKLAELFPELVRGYDENGVALLNLKGNVDGMVSSLDALIETQRRLANEQIVASMPDAMGGIKTEIDGYEKDIEKLKNQKDELTGVMTDASEVLSTHLISSQDGTQINKMIDTLDKLGIQYTKTKMMIDDGSSVMPAKKPYELFEFTEPKDIAQTYATLMAEADKEISKINDKIAKSSSRMNPFIKAWMETDYKFTDFSEELQSVVSTMVSGIDFVALGKDTAEEVQSYINDNILEPLYYATPEASKAFAQIFDMQDSLKAGKISAEEFSTYVQDTFAKLLGGMDEVESDNFKNVFVSSFNKAGIEGETFDDVLVGLIADWSKLNTTAEKFNDDIMSLADALEALDKNGKFISSVKEEFKELGTLSTKSLNDIIDAYPVLEGAVTDYLTQKITEKDLINELGKAYETDFDNYRTAVLGKRVLDEDFYNDIIAKLPLHIKALADSYEIDFDHYKSLQEAKLDLAKEFQEKLLLISKADEMIANPIPLPFGMKDYSGKLQKIGTDFSNQVKTQAQEEADAITKIIDSINTTIDTTIDLKPYQAEPDKSKKTKKTKDEKDFADSIDWSSERVKKLQGEIAKLDAQLENSTSLDKRLSITNQLIDKQQELSDAYNSSAKSYKANYDKALNDKSLTKQDKTNIENGSYKVEDFKGKGDNSADELRFKAITKAIEAKELLTSANTALYESEFKITELAKNLADLRWDKADENVAKLRTDLEVLNAELDNADSYDERNAKLAEILAKQAEIVAEYKNALTGNKTDAKTLFGKISKKNQVNNKGESVKFGQKIKTTGVVDQEQLTWIKEYNAQIDEYRTNKKALAIENEEYANETDATNEETYQNEKTHYQDELDLIGNSKQDIMNDIEEVKALGGEATAEQYQSLVNLSKKEASNYEQRKQLALDALKFVDVGSDRYYDLQQDIQACDDAISDTKQEQASLNKSIIELPISALEKANEEYKKTLDLLNDQKDSFDKVIGAVTDSLDDEIKTLNEEKELINNEDIAGTYANRIKLIQDEVDALQAVNEQHKKEMELQQAQYNAERARNQKTQMVYREGEGMVNICPIT